MGIILALVSALFTAFFLYIYKVLVVKAKDPVVVAMGFSAWGALFCWILAIFEERFYKISFEVILFQFLSACCYAAFNILNSKANKVLDLSLNSIIGQVSLLVSFFGSLIVFKEPFLPSKIIGVLLVVIGSVIPTISKDGGKVNSRGIIYKFIAAFMVGIAAITDGLNTPNISTFLLSAFSYSSSAFLIFIYLSITSKSNILVEIKQLSWRLVLMGFVSVSGYVTFILALSNAPKSIANGLVNLSTIFSVLLGIILLKEKDNLLKKILGTVLVFSGALIISLF